MQQVITIVTVIVVGFALGQVIQAYYRGNLARIRDIAIAVALRFSLPLAIGLAIWDMPAFELGLLVLPWTGLAMLLGGFLIGYGLSRFYGFTGKQRGVFAPAGGFTNIGAVGALATLIILGEPGLALIPLIKLFEELVYYGFFFTYAANQGDTHRRSALAGLKDPIILSMLIALIVGYTLLASGIDRPDAFGLLPGILVPLGTFSLMVSVGLIFQIHTVMGNWREALVLSLAKQFGLPALVFGLFWVFGLTGLADGMAVKTSVLIAFMPMAAIVILPANLYQLDQKLANACLFFSVLVFLVSLPFIPWLLAQL